MNDPTRYSPAWTVNSGLIIFVSFSLSPSYTPSLSLVESVYFIGGGTAIRWMALLDSSMV